MGEVYQFPHTDPSEESVEPDDGIEPDPPFNLGVLIRSRMTAIQRHPASHNGELAADAKLEGQNSDDTPPLA